MAGCEKCWSDAGRIAASRGTTTKVEEYSRLIDEREDHPCTPEQQCGEMHLALDWKDGTRHCVCGKVGAKAPISFAALDTVCENLMRATDRSRTDPDAEIERGKDG